VARRVRAQRWQGQNGPGPVGGAETPSIGPGRIFYDHRVYVGTLSIDLLLGDVHSLKQKRSVVRPILAELQRKYAVSAAEVGEQDLYRRTRIGLATVSGDAGHVNDVLDRCERLVAARPEVELLSVRRRFHGEEDE
jgi:uncharacterized protein